jgi:cytoskeleton protein RodZ
MATAIVETEKTGLGQYLKAVREERGIELQTVSTETKISMHNLQAMEEEEYSALPAIVFTRGYYRLYATILGLDHEEILGWFEREFQAPPEAGAVFSPQRKNAMENAMMAERPSTLNIPATLGLILLALLTFGGFLCWYFSWNPAAFLSQQLRELENPKAIHEAVDQDGQAGLYRPLSGQDKVLAWREDTSPS